MITTLLNDHCELGENPLWNGDDGCLYWTDITGGKVHRLHVESGRHEAIYRGVPVGGFTLQKNGALLLFRVSDLALLHADGHVSRAIREVEFKSPPIGQESEPGNGRRHRL